MMHINIRIMCKPYTTQPFLSSRHPADALRLARPQPRSTNTRKKRGRSTINTQCNQGTRSTFSRDGERRARSHGDGLGFVLGPLGAPWVAFRVYMRSFGSLFGSIAVSLGVPWGSFGSPSADPVQSVLGPPGGSYGTRRVSAQAESGTSLAPLAFQGFLHF
jgi:hypothetical protein